ncbi:MAG: polyhydroxyalkanoate synthesis repressor PhaR [Rickettsiales bacterium]|nr:polyhydroxyalkanoate synthesis repressor PhaR [Rickettsiales bacterium]
MTNQNNENITIIKKYTNRRLYNTATSVYITLEDLCEMVKQGEDFKVVDSKTGADLTRQTLTQVIFDQESKGYNLLPISFLKQIITYYDDSLKGIVPQYLEWTMENFNRNRDHIESLFNQMPFGNMPSNINKMSVDFYEQIAKQNMDMFYNTMEMFGPFAKRNETTKEDEDPNDNS